MLAPLEVKNQLLVFALTIAVENADALADTSDFSDFAAFAFVKKPVRDMFPDFASQAGNLFCFFLRTNMYSDPIADLLTRIRNGVRAGKKTVVIPHSKIKEAVAEILEHTGFIEKARVDRTGKFPEIRVELSENHPKLSLRRVSRPGLRIYRSAADFRPVKHGFGIAVVSTSKGLMTTDEAKKEGIGGEVLCEVS